MIEVLTNYFGSVLQAVPQGFWVVMALGTVASILLGLHQLLSPPE